MAYVIINPELICAVVQPGMEGVYRGGGVKCYSGFWWQVVSVGSPLLGSSQETPSYSTCVYQYSTCVYRYYICVLCILIKLYNKQ